MNLRSQIPHSTFKEIFKELEYRNNVNIQDKGLGAFASNHKIYGVLAEELNEYLDAIQQKQSSADKIDELYDIAVAAIFGIASINNQSVNW